MPGRDRRRGSEHGSGGWAPALRARSSMLCTRRRHLLIMATMARASSTDTGPPLALKFGKLERRAEMTIRLCDTGCSDDRERSNLLSEFEDKPNACGAVDGARRVLGPSLRQRGGLRSTMASCSAMPLSDDAEDLGEDISTSLPASVVESSARAHYVQDAHPPPTKSTAVLHPDLAEVDDLRSAARRRGEETADRRVKHERDLPIAGHERRAHVVHEVKQGRHAGGCAALLPEPARSPKASANRLVQQVSEGYA